MLILEMIIEGVTSLFGEILWGTASDTLSTGKPCKELGAWIQHSFLVGVENSCPFRQIRYMDEER